MKRRILISILFSPIILFAAIELIGRQVGLTDPPLSIEDPDMEYRFAPNQDCMMLGRRNAYNNYSQRSDQIRDRKPGDLRILVIGDSIPNGGTMVDQADLATSQLEKILQQKTGRSTQVLNASAGSWGPPNELAYVKRFGTFDADAFVVVFSTQDVDDHMTFEKIVGVNSSYPDVKPRTASWYLYDRYLPRFIAIMQAQNAAISPKLAAFEQPVMDNITELVQFLKATGKPVVAVLHPQREEVNTPGDDEGTVAIKNAAIKGGAIVVDGRLKYREAIKKYGNFYRDTIHPNPIGQHVLGELMAETLQPLIEADSKK